MKNSFKNLSFAELKAKRDELNRKYMELRFQMVIGHVENPLQKRTMRRQIARLNTLIRLEEIAQAKAALKEAALQLATASATASQPSVADAQAKE